MQLSNEQVEQLTAALAPIRNRTTRTELRSILRDWAACDLEGHLARPTPDALRLQNQQLAAVATQCRLLTTVLDQLDVAARYELEAQLAGVRRGSIHKLPAMQKRQAAARALCDEPGRLARIAAAADSAAAAEPLPMHHKTVVGYLILLDLAAIFEHATGVRAERMVRGPDHGDYGRDFGAFWEFSSVAWRIVFGSTSGLSAAFKRWARARDEHGEVSAVIANIRLRRRAMANSKASSRGFRH